MEIGFCCFNHHARESVKVQWVSDIICQFMGDADRIQRSAGRPRGKSLRKPLAFHIYVTLP
jgi:hypothetical protein